MPWEVFNSCLFDPFLVGTLVGPSVFWAITNFFYGPCPGCPPSHNFQGRKFQWLEIQWLRQWVFVHLSFKSLQFLPNCQVITRMFDDQVVMSLTFYNTAVIAIAAINTIATSTIYPSLSATRSGATEIATTSFFPTSFPAFYVFVKNNCRWNHYGQGRVKYVQLR